MIPNKSSRMYRLPHLVAVDRDVKPIEKQKVKIALSKTDVLLSVITSVSCPL